MTRMLRAHSREFSYIVYRISYFVFLFLGLIAPISAHATCCKCQAPDSTDTLCMTITSGDACGTFAEKSADAKTKQLKCEPEALNVAQCKPVAQGGICVTEGDSASYGKPKIVASSTQEVLPLKLNVPIPGVSFTTAVAVKDGHLAVPFLAQYIAAIYRYLLGITALAAAIMIVYGGFLYILGSTFESITKGKEYIVNAVTGLFLMFSSYTILAVINPATLNLKTVDIDLIKRLEIVKPEQIRAVTGEDPLSTADMLTRAQEKAKALAGEKFACFVYASMVHESGGRMNVVGHDENAQSIKFAVGSRQKFLQSGKLYSDEAFEPIDCRDRSCQNAKILNNDVFNLTMPPLYDLDWRYSHGIGAGQSTIFPESKPCEGKEALGRGFRVCNECYTIQDLMRADKQIDAMLCHYKTCWGKTSDGSDPAKGYICYGGASLTPDNAIIVERVDVYNKCAEKIVTP